MGSEANRDEALKCLHLSRKHWEAGNRALAFKLATKSVSLFDTTDGRVWLDKIKGQYDPSKDKEDDTDNVQKTAKTEEEKKPERPGSTGSTASFTVEQVAEVKRFAKINKDDYYAVLGIAKGASDGDIKKAYRKVRK